MFFYNPEAGSIIVDWVVVTGPKKQLRHKRLNTLTDQHCLTATEESGVSSSNGITRKPYICYSVASITHTG